ncbi:MAG TPA: hypothetical protein VLY86_02510 [Methanothrix sp.]|nr:hypothetical protein [Methanothrix sp.]
MKETWVCCLLLYVVAMGTQAVAPINLSGEHGQAVLANVTTFHANNTSSGEGLWGWGGSPQGYAQVYPSQGQSNDFGGWAPTGETPLGYTLNETKQIVAGQGQQGYTQMSSFSGETPLGYDLNDSNQLFPSGGFFNGYGGWSPGV